MSEMELSIVRQRSLEALEQKARRGELFLNVAIGYLKVSNDRIDKDPDRRIQEALALVFTKFAEMQTPRQGPPLLTAGANHFARGAAMAPRAATSNGSYQCTIRSTTS
ncbi:hypothetical protein [Bradyrhizobium diazoefficiens]|uniref:hypothetical protein n=1 Tax=Bradyrhizobium diazoefficiens TaxID=1355477 RepID=UPI0035173576